MLAGLAEGARIEVRSRDREECGWLTNVTSNFDRGAAEKDRGCGGLKRSTLCGRVSGQARRDSARFGRSVPVPLAWYWCTLAAARGGADMGRPLLRGSGRWGGRRPRGAVIGGQHYRSCPTSGVRVWRSDYPSIVPADRVVLARLKVLGVSEIIFWMCFVGGSTSELASGRSPQGKWRSKRSRIAYEYVKR